MSSSEVLIEQDFGPVAAVEAAPEVRRGRPALAAFLQNSVKLDRRELLVFPFPPFSFLLEFEHIDLPELLELELLISSCDDLVL